jgi:puromycin-sensitive aminopeptidase
MMDGWIFRQGYPLVSVEADAEGLTLRQRRFTSLGTEGDSDERWRVPVLVRASVKRGYVEKPVLLADAEARVTLPAKADWVVVNAGGHGVYRVQYSAPLLRALGKALAKIAPIERFNLASDAVALSQAGLMPATELLDLTGRFTAETDRNVWLAITGAFAYVNRVVGDDVRPGLEAVVRHRIAPSMERLSWEADAADSELTRQLRGDLVRVLGTLGNDAETQSQARALWERWRDDEAGADPNLLPAVIAVLAFVGGDAEYEECSRRFKSARTPQEEQRYLFALAGFRPPELVARTLERCLNGEIRSQDAPFVLRAMLASVHAREQTWAFVKQHWQEMSGKYPGSAYRRLYEGVTGLVSPAWEADVQAFFADNAIDLGGKTLAQYLEQLRVAVRFQERESAALAAYLAKPPR